MTSLKELLCSKFDAEPIALDIDGTISERPEFFSVLTHVWPGKVHIITYREKEDRDQTIAQLEEMGIFYDSLYIADSFEDKSRFIAENNIKVFMDDMDEIIRHVPEDVLVLKPRNGGNYEAGRWIYSDKTGKRI